MDNIYSIQKRLPLISKRIKEERTNKNKTNSKSYTQDELADECNCHRTLVIKWEKGEQIPAVEHLLKMCELFNCELGYLLCDEQYKNKTRDKTFICQETGLSEKAVDSLLDIQQNSSGLNAFFNKGNSERVSCFSTELGGLNELLEKNICDEEPLDYEIIEGNPVLDYLICNLKTLVNQIDIESAYYTTGKRLLYGCPFVNEMQRRYNDLNMYYEDYTFLSYDEQYNIFFDAMKDYFIETNPSEREEKKFKFYAKTYFKVLKQKDNERMRLLAISDSFLDIVKDYLKD